ncbi:RraA family protein [Microbacterium sp. RD1]|uniref:RraA family protein n=1 Tax=Microbacterium sp. RD1 TaxID=3457313 RepID=UPI003FA57EFC
MFRIGQTPTPLSPHSTSIASRVDPSTLGHWRDRGLAHGIKPLTAERTFVGTAFTVRLCDMDATAIHYAADLLEPGHVLVVDMGGDRERACVGSILAFLAAHRGAAGIVVDGMATDLADLERVGLPVFARGTSAMTTRVLGIEGDVNVPVVIDGVVVSPGDVVIGTADGLLFIDEQDLLELADQAIAAQHNEPEIMHSLTEGTPLASLSGAGAAMERAGILRV